MNVAPPKYADILDAQQRHGGRVFRTPLLEDEVLNDLLGVRLMVKAECLQRTGSFKIRGALNRLEALTSEQRARGVVAFSSGNHAQGVARAARWLGIDAIIVMPNDAPRNKVSGVVRDGGRIVFYDRETESREAIADRISQHEGRTVVPSYDDPFIIAGQGTCGLEIADQCEQIGVTPDHVLCCAGGGGLIAGLSLGVKEHFPAAEIWSCEPEGFDDHLRSLNANEILRATGKTKSICDAILTPEPGKLTFEINRRTLAGGFAVTDTEVLTAMRCAFERLKLVVEPGGAVAFAAALHRLPARFKGSVVCVVLTGGNVDTEVFTRCLDGDPDQGLSDLNPDPPSAGRVKA